MTMKLPNTISALQQGLSHGTLALTDVLAHQHQQFKELGQRLHAVTHYLPAAADQALDRKKPLTGVGLAHKDIFDLPDRAPGLGRDKGKPSRGICAAPAIETLHAAGALNLGALAMAEDACAATGQTASITTPLNPLGEHLAVGGSSSGSGVAVASAMVYGALGTDTAGSVRIPAMTCGVMGLKTTHGLISTQGVAALSPSLDSVGVLARSVQDLTSLFEVLASDRPAAATVDTSKLRTTSWLTGTTLDDNVRRAIEPALVRYGQAEADFSDHEYRATALQQLIMVCETGQIHHDRIACGQACRQVVDLGIIGLATPSHWFSEALRLRSVYARAFIEQAFAQTDVLLLPLQVSSLPRVHEVYLGHSNFEPRKLLDLHRYCGWINYLGLPALALPVGVDADGLPVSIQLVAKPLHEHQLLAFGQKIQHDLLGEDGIEPVCKIQEQTA